MYKRLIRFMRLRQEAINSLKCVCKPEDVEFMVSQAEMLAKASRYTTIHYLDLMARELNKHPEFVGQARGFAKRLKAAEGING